MKPRTSAWVKRNIQVGQAWRRPADGAVICVEHAHRKDRLARGTLVELYEDSDGNISRRVLSATITFSALGREWLPL